MSSNRMEIIPDLNLPVVICEFDTHQTESPDQDAFDSFMAPISKDVDLENRVADFAGAIVPADKMIAVDYEYAAADVADAIVPADKVITADTENLSFVKHRHLWEDAESQEAFRNMSHKPHFFPSKSLKEIRREGKALCHMVTFENIAKNASNLHPGTKRKAIVDDLSLLEELEANGFDVEKLKDSLNRMLLLKDLQEKLDNLSKEKKRRLCRLTELDEEKCKLQERGAEIEEKIRELFKEADIGEELCSTKIQIKELVASPLC